jgi:hypothetical protein
MELKQPAGRPGVMSQEIRKVPKGWEHPKSDGKYIPLYRESFIEAFEEWHSELMLWLSGHSENYDDRFYTRDARGYCRYAGQSPDPDKYREQEWTDEEAACYQIYQTVSEGTPISPVFESLAEMESWLIEKGYSKQAAQSFCKEGWAISASYDPSRGWKEGIHTLD